MNGIDEAFAEVAKFTIKFCRDNNQKFVFLTKRPKGKDSDLEFGFYRKFLSPEEYAFLFKNSLPHFGYSLINFNKYSTLLSIFINIIILFLIPIIILFLIHC